MDILIKGMEMPKYCEVCPLRVDGLHTFQCVRLLGRAYTYELEEQRQEDCPLVEIPKHGELISRGGALFQLQAEALGISPNDKDFEGIKKGLLIARKIIIEAPVIVEATE